MRFLTIGESLGRPECPYLRRWAINFGWFSIRVHHWLSGDDPRAFHDHPWSFVTLVLKGSYLDISESGTDVLVPGTVRFRPAAHRHTVKLVPGQHCWTIMLTGPVVRKWGFYVRGQSNKVKFKKSNKYFLEHGHHQCSDQG
jgi:hypothetical protein